MKIKGFFSKDNLVEKKVSIKLSKSKLIKIPTDKSACSQCGLYKQKEIRNPKLKPYGKFRNKVLIIAEAPGRVEDKEGRPFSPNAQAGGFLHEVFEDLDLDLYKDCLIVNGTDCRPIDGNSNRAPSNKELKCCYYRKKEVIEKYKPEVILLLGDKAKESFYSFDPDRQVFKSSLMSSLRGKGIPDRNSNAWIFHSYHPSYIVRGKDDMANIFKLDIKLFSKFIGKGHPKFIDFTKRSEVITEYKEARKLLRNILRKKLSFSFDYESSSFRYYEGIHEIYMVSIHTKDTTYLLPIDFPRKTNSKKGWWKKKQRKNLLQLWKDILENEEIRKSAQNIKHEAQASHYVLGINIKGWYHDTMIGAHVIDEAKGITGLKFQAYQKFGQYHYGLPSSVIGALPKEKNYFTKIPFDVASQYCITDSKITNELIPIQKKTLRRKRLTKAYKLFHEGAQAFAEIERNGIKINVPLAKRLDRMWGKDMLELKEKILTSKEARKFEKRKGKALAYKKKLSDKDLRILLYDILKFKPIKETKTTYSVDEEVLSYYAKEHDCPILDYELKYRHLNKLKNTYLSQFLAYEVDGFIYPTFNLHLAQSYRSSSDSPNFQNIPKQAEDAWEIRQIITTRWGKDGFLVEVDYGSMEVRIIACVTHDPALIDYIVSGGDMHGDWAEIIFKIKKNEISKKEFKEYRFIAKNHWTFPLFYGSWYEAVAENTKRPEWFRTQAQWKEHLKKCEKKFWKQFKGVRKWQDEYVKAYKKQGYVRDFSWGFERHGYLTRNKIYNFPIQGPAYHCLQWTINELWKKSFYNLESLLCGEIHDALFWDCKKEELPKLRKKVHYLMTEKIREENPWIIVPLVDEWTKGKNWAKMKETK